MKKKVIQKLLFLLIFSALSISILQLGCNLPIVQYARLDVLAGEGGTTEPRRVVVAVQDEPLQIKASAAYGYQFVNWTVETGESVVIDDSTAAVTSVTLKNLSGKIKAHFQRSAYTISRQINPLTGGIITIDPAKEAYQTGEIVRITATSGPGYTFINWGGDLTGTTNPVDFTITGNINITAHFEPHSYTLVTNRTPSGSGDVTPGGTYSYGSTVSLTATPFGCYTFKGWSGDLTGTANPALITITGNMNIVAQFELKSVTLTTSVSPAGGGFVTPGGTYNCGNVVILTAVPAAGHVFTGWSGDLTGTTNPANILLTADMNITANFSP